MLFGFGVVSSSVFGDELRGIGRESKRSRRVQARRALVAGQKIRDALGKVRRFHTLVQRLGEREEALLLQANERQNTRRINPVRLTGGGGEFSMLRIGFRAVLQAEVEAHRILGTLGGALSGTGTGGQQVCRQGTAQQCPMRRLTQVRGADDSRGAVRSRALQAVKLHRVGQPRRGGRHQGYRARCAARVLAADYSATDRPTADHATFGQHSQALAVRLAGALGLLGDRACRLLLRTLLKLGVEPQLAGGGCGQISEGEGKVHGDFSAGGERNKAGLKPAG